MNKTFSTGDTAADITVSRTNSLTSSLTGSNAGIAGEPVNDRHSALNQTAVKKVIAPCHHRQLNGLVRSAAAAGDRIAVAGGRHAMGGQQFLDGGILIDTSLMNRVIKFDAEAGLITVESGMRWPELIGFLKQAQIAEPLPWTIRQKQTGCDALSIGGALSANVHGRGLLSAPFVADVEEFELVTADGATVVCSRQENSQLFTLAIGGYGMFGLIATATLRLERRSLLERNVELVEAGQVISKLENYAANGATFGDFQFNIDSSSVDFLQHGILSTYRPVDSPGSLPGDNKLLTHDDWRELVYLAHTDKAAAFDRYAKHYLASNQQLYWSDTFQLSTYIDDYHTAIDKRMGSSCKGTEVISELYVPRDCLADFLKKAASFLQTAGANVIYGTVRLIKADHETFLPWARADYACIVFNLHVNHSVSGLATARQTFRGLIDLAASFNGSYYLTYHRYASAEQLRACYPQIAEFIRRKKFYDQGEVFSSDWYRQIVHCA